MALGKHVLQANAFCVSLPVVLYSSTYFETSVHVYAKYLYLMRDYMTLKPLLNYLPCHLTEKTNFVYHETEIIM